MVSVQIDVANLRRQLEEVEVAEAVYSGDGEFEWPSSQLDNVSILKGLLQSLEDADAIIDPIRRETGGKMEGGTCPRTSLSLAGNGECARVSFLVHLRTVILGGRHISVSFRFPPGYPETEPVEVAVECKGRVSRCQHDRLVMEAQKKAMDLLGSESTLEVIQSVRDMAMAMADEEEDAGPGVKLGVGAAVKTAAAAPSLPSPSAADATSIVIMRCLIWFHHIKSIEKRKSIVEWGRELQLGGYCKPGFPGVILCEGEEGDVKEFIERLQRLRWKAMTVREEEREESREGQSADDLRRFQRKSLSELAETGMSELAGYCREVGLERLFLTAMKIYR